MENWYWDIIKWLFSFIGHLGLWFVPYDNIHATAWPRQYRKTTEKVTFLIILLPAAWVLTVLIGQRSISFASIYQASPVAYYYGVACIWLGCIFVCRWVWRNAGTQIPSAVTSRSTRMLDVQRELGKPILHGRLARALGKIPGNQATHLAIESTTLTLPGCPAVLDGLKICQLSDLHFTGRLAAEYFQEVARHVNEFEPDLIFITGDIIDRPDCLPWLELILPRLSARIGVYYVLGNHDRRISDESLLRRMLAGCNAIAAGGNGTNLKLTVPDYCLLATNCPGTREQNRCP